MGNNFFTDLTSAMTFTDADLSVPFEELDRAITYLKNIIVHCDGDVTFDPDTGVLTWEGTLRILFNRADGYAIQNTVAAGNITLSANEFAYVDLNATNNTALSMAKAAVTTGAASNFKAYNRLVLGYRNTASGKFFSVYLQAGEFAES